MRTQILAGVAILIIGMGGALAARAQNSPFDHRLTEDPVQVFVMLPAATADADTLARRIAVSAGVPLGFEAAIGDLPEASDNRQRLLLTGKTVREALDTLVDVDNRYSWRQIGGLAVIRPHGAWDDPHNPLNQPVADIAWDGMTPQQFVVRVAGLLYGQDLSDRPASPSDTSDHIITARLRSGTVLDLLNESVRSERSASWAVTYGGRRPFSAEVQFTISLRDIDGRAYAFTAGTRPPSMGQGH